MKQKSDVVVTLDYLLLNATQEVQDFIKREGTFCFIPGKKQVLQGIEAAVRGKKEGDRFRVDLTPEQGFGARNPELEQTVSKDLFPGHVKLMPGMQFRPNDEKGNPLPLMTVVRVDENDVVVDGNHPLAGLALSFDLSVKEIRPATPQELASSGSLPT